MLIVVAIIAILIAVSIPLVDSALQKAKHAADAANERAAKAAMIIKYLDGSANAGTFYVYDAKDGEIKTAIATGMQGYGQHKGRNNTYYILATITADGKVNMAWGTTVPSGAGAVLPADDAAGLCSTAKDVAHSS